MAKKPKTLNDPQVVSNLIPEILTQNLVKMSLNYK
jgi:hypothetical protein